MTIKEFQTFLEKVRDILSSNEIESGCAYMDALKAFYPSIYDNLPDELNTSTHREHIPLLFEYLIKRHEK